MSIAAHGGFLAIREGLQPVSRRTNLRKRNVKTKCVQNVSMMFALEGAFC